MLQVGDNVFMTSKKRKTTEFTLQKLVDGDNREDFDDVLSCRGEQGDFSELLLHNTQAIPHFDLASLALAAQARIAWVGRKPGED